MKNLHIWEFALLAVVAFGIVGCGEGGDSGASNQEEIAKQQSKLPPTDPNPPAPPVRDDGKGGLGSKRGP